MFRLILVLVGATFIVFTLNRQYKPTKSRYHYVFPSTEIKRFTFGFDEVMGDSHWVRVLQDSDVCVHPKAPKDAPRTGVDRIPHCELDWVYHMINVITELAPKFRFAYFFGGTILSVVVDDVKGATLIYEKAVARFPHDWQLSYHAATHIMVEVGDMYRAAYLYQKAVQNGGPKWVAALSAKLYDQAGRTELAVFNLKRLIKLYPYDKFVDQAKKRLAVLEKSLSYEQISKINRMIESDERSSPDSEKSP